MTQAEDAKIGDVVDRSDMVCIIGAGPSGLAMARALKARDIPFDHYERNEGIGGLWDIDAPGSPMYSSAHFISSKTLSGFSEFPMPDDYPDYPSHDLVLAYLRDFAARYGLDEGIQLGLGIDQIDKSDDGTWLVHRADGVSVLYRAVVCCTGAQWEPNLPPTPGSFAGTVMHSAAYRDARDFVGKRVVVVGGGNSACDIAVDVSRVAARTIISMRRGYWFIPKHIFGVPSDVFAEHGPPMPKWLEQPLMAWILQRLYGKPERLGLQRPDHKLFETHPVLNSNLYLSLQHGDIIARPGILGTDREEIEFVDGSREQADAIIYATGYRHSAPYAQDLFGDSQHPNLYLTCFSREHHNLFGGSFTETNTGAYIQFDTTAMMIASYLDDQSRRPDVAARFDRLIKADKPDLSGGIKFDSSPRHKGYVDGHAFIRYRAKLSKQLGWGFKDAPVISGRRTSPLAAAGDGRVAR